MSKLKAIALLLSSGNIEDAANTFADYTFKQVIPESFDSPRSVANELYNYISNNSNLYKYGFIPLAKRIESLKRKNTYKISYGVRNAKKIADRGAMLYAKEFGDRNVRWSEMFPDDIRELTAEKIEDYITREIEYGNSWL